jgi:filamentous hemagglutinin family protein
MSIWRELGHGVGPGEACARAAGRRANLRRIAPSLLPLLAVLAAGPALAAPVLPTGGTVAAGSATIGTPSGAALSISQSSSRAIIDWSGFSIGAGATVRFDNGTGATLNRVTGGSVSSIDGLLSASGSVYLINPNGVIVGKDGVVNVGGTFVASSLDTSNSGFMAGGNLTFTGPSPASVINLGRVGSLGGDVVLIGATVQNSGSITAPNGDVGLIAGQSVLMRDGSLNDGRFTVLVGGQATSSTNTGAITAAEAELRAEGGNVYALAGNTTGVIRATGVVTGGGKVFLVAEGGTTTLGGTIQARSAGGAGGAIETSGSTVNIGQAVIDAGAGGTWLLDPNDLTIDQTAANTIDTSLNAGTSVTQKTTASGTGGNGDITVSPGVTLGWNTAAGLTLSAYRNIAIGAGAHITSTGGGSVTLYADNAATGTGTVSFGSGALVSTASAVNLFYNPASNPAGSAINTTSFTNPANYAGFVAGGATLTAYMLVNTLNDLQNVQNNLTGNYAQGADIDASATANVIYHSIGSPTIPFRGLFDGQGHVIESLYGLNGGVFGVSAGTIRNVGVVGGHFGGSGDVGALAGINTGTIAGSYATSTVGGLDSVGGLVGDNLGGSINNSYANGTLIVVTNAVAVGGLAGANSGFITNSYATGTIAGTYVSEIGGLVGENTGTINQSYSAGAINPAIPFLGSGMSYVGGLVGLNTGPINQSYSTVSITGSEKSVGGLAGSSSGSITLSYATGAITGSVWVGGLVGQNTGLIIASYATGAVVGNQAGDFGVDIGGLVGMNSASISRSYATGAVSGFASVGGLVGDNNGSLAPITQSYATGTVTSTASGQTIGSDIGGLVGQNSGGPITDSFATGDVFGSATVGTGIGGLIGSNQNAKVTGDYATGNVSGFANVGGLAGENTGAPGATITQAYATGAVTGVTTVGGLVGLNSGSIVQAYSTGAVTGGSALGGLVGVNGGTVTASYWDTTTSGQSTSAGGVGLTTAQFSVTSNLVGFTFGTTAGGPGWVIVDANRTLNNAGGAAGATRPMLLSEYSTTLTNAHQVQLMALNLSANYTLGADIDLTAANGANAAGLWTSAGFVPIGAAVPFTGSLDGAGHTISNLVIDRPTTNDVGLFGVIGAGGVVKNLTLSGGSVTGLNGVGDLAGVSDGAITGVSASGSVTGTSMVGGLIGWNDKAGVVSGASDAGATVTAGADGGGLVGYNLGHISASAAGDDVMGTGSAYALGTGVGLNGAIGIIASLTASGSVSIGGNLTNPLIGVDLSPSLAALPSDPWALTPPPAGSSAPTTPPPLSPAPLGVSLPPDKPLLAAVISAASPTPVASAARPTTIPTFRPLRLALTSRILRPSTPPHRQHGKIL